MKASKGKTTMQSLKALFGILDPLVLKKQELLEAQLSLLEAQTGLDYANALVTYNTTRIARLQQSILQDEAAIMTVAKLTPTQTTLVEVAG